MSRKTIEQTGEFMATSPDGEEVDILIFTEFHEGRTSEGPYRTQGLKQLRTASGTPVNRIAKGRYRVFDSQIELTSDDDQAP